MTPVQGSLLAAPVAQKPHKRVRAVSSERYHAMVATGLLSLRQQEFLTALAQYHERVGTWPTLKELTEWAYGVGCIHRPDPNFYRPRATELSGSVVEYLPRRRCTITGQPAHPIRVREVGSEEPR